MKRRSLAARLAILAGCALVLAGVGSMAGAAPAAADMNLEGLKPPAVPEIPEPPEVTPPEPSNCGCAPMFTIEKLQEIAGSGRGFTASPLIGAIGQKVDYEIMVTNTGTFPQTLSEFTDPHCDDGTIAGGPGTDRLTPGDSVTYTCGHVLDAAGAYTNEARVTATTLCCETLTQTSNQVVVEVPGRPPPPQKPEFTIEKLQEIAGSKAGFTTSPLTGAVGQTVEYQIVVTNTGDVSLVLTEFTDEHCDANTLAGGPGESAVAPGGSTAYTCTRALVSEGKFANQASVIGTPPGGQPLTKTSNQVVVEVPPAAKVPPAAIIAPPVSSPQVPKIAVKCFFAVKPILRGASGTKRKPFMLRLAGIGALKQVSLYLDGRKLKTLRHAQLKSGRFSMRIDPRKLRYGAHKVLITMAALEAGCPGSRLSSVFVDPPPTPPPPG